MRTFARHITIRQAIICPERLKSVQNRRKNSHAGRKRDLVATGMDCRHLLLQCAAESLTSQQYQVWVLCYCEGLTQREVSAILDVNPSDVSRCLRVAQTKMRKLLGFAVDLPTEQDYDYDE